MAEASENRSMMYLKTLEEIECNLKRHHERIRRLEVVAEAARDFLACPDRRKFEGRKAFNRLFIAVRSLEDGERG